MGIKKIVNLENTGGVVVELTMAETAASGMNWFDCDNGWCIYIERETTSDLGFVSFVLGQCLRRCRFEAGNWYLT